METSIIELIDSINWNIFENAVLNMVKKAVEKYREQFNNRPDEKVYQIAINTDIQAATSDISFEVLVHATKTLQQQIAFFRARGLYEAAEKLQHLNYSVDPGGFEHVNFASVQHPELSILSGLYSDFQMLLDAEVEKHLLAVKQEIALQKLLRYLPAEEYIWIGTSSPYDHYDHVSKIKMTV